MRKVIWMRIGKQKGKVYDDHRARDRYIIETGYLICELFYKLFVESGMNIKEKIQTQLRAMARQDQEIRKSGKWNKMVDRGNTKKLKAIIKKFGWPDIDLVGRADSHSAWLIAQHADHDVRFQEECLALMEARREKIDPIEIAYLSDRIRVNRGERQLYGTQFYVNKSGKLVPRPICDKKNLDQRRERLGMGNFRECWKRLAKSHNKLDKK